MKRTLLFHRTVSITCIELYSQRSSIKEKCKSFPLFCNVSRTRLFILKGLVSCSNPNWEDHTLSSAFGLAEFHYLGTSCSVRISLNRRKWNQGSQYILGIIYSVSSSSYFPSPWYISSLVSLFRPNLQSLFVLFFFIEGFQFILCHSRLNIRGKKQPNMFNDRMGTWWGKKCLITENSQEDVGRHLSWLICHRD